MTISHAGTVPPSQLVPHKERLYQSQSGDTGYVVLGGTAYQLLELSESVQLNVPLAAPSPKLREVWMSDSTELSASKPLDATTKLGDYYKHLYRPQRYAWQNQFWLFGEPESSTIQAEFVVEELSSRFETLFKAAIEESFEDGIASQFSKGLKTLILRYGNLAIDLLSSFIASDKLGYEIVSETLRWLGQIEHPLSHQKRLWLLEHNLSHTSARVRDGAILGLSFMDDPTAIAYIERAINKEAVRELRHDMQEVLSQLKSTLGE
jgi:hypothetical protein